MVTTVCVCAQSLIRGYTH